MTLERATALDSLQKAIYERLTQEITDVQTFDYVEQGQATPYIEIGEDVTIPDDTKDIPGEIIQVTIHAFSNEKGKKEVKGIIGRIETALTKSDLNLTADGFTLLETVSDEKQTLTDEEDEIEHGVIKVSFKIQKS